MFRDRLRALSIMRLRLRRPGEEYYDLKKCVCVSCWQRVELSLLIFSISSTGFVITLEIYCCVNLWPVPPEELRQRGKTHPECGQHHLMGLVPDWIKASRVPAFISLITDYRPSVASCPRFLLPSRPSFPELAASSKWNRNKPSLPLDTSIMYFIIVVRRS